MGPELANRTAEMLNSFLAKLVGPKMGEIKAKNMDRYKFRPKRLLKEICEIYVHFSLLLDDSGFAEAVVRDQRSYSAQNLSKAIEKLSKLGLMDVGTLQKFKAFVQVVACALITLIRATLVCWWV